MKTKYNIYIDAACDIHYASFYIEGLKKVFGFKFVNFSSKYFSEFKHNNHFFAFVIKENNIIHKIVIDFTDEDLIDAKAHQWSDIYAKININYFESTDFEKLISIGPSFGIRIFSKLKTVTLAFFNLIIAYNRIPVKKKFLSDYKAQFKRLRLDDYDNKNFCHQKNYVFFVSSLWKKETDTNKFRANFITAVKKIPEVIFEGGFAPRTKSDMPEFNELILKEKVNLKNYINKTKKSLVVFNTPAVLSCHGWKLAEFLALGKVILSTPLSRKLPYDLMDNQHLLFTDGSINSITDKVNMLLYNPDMKDKIEKQSFNYYDTFLAPDKVIIQICNKLKISNFNNFE